MALGRITIDKQKFGRNAYNDLYHWTARYSYLEKLIAEGREDYHIVYIDPDVLVLRDLHEVFEREFDYTVTISENDEQPINGAMHFVPKGKYQEVRSLGTHTCSDRCVVALTLCTSEHLRPMHRCLELSTCQPHQVQQLTCGHRGLGSKHCLTFCGAWPFIVHLTWSAAW